MIWGERCLGARRFRWAGSWKIEGTDCAEGGAFFLTTEGTEGPEEKAGDCWSHAEPRGETRGSEEGSLRVVAPLTPGPSPLPGARGRGGGQRVVWLS